MDDALTATINLLDDPDFMFRHRIGTEGREQKLSFTGRGPRRASYMVARRPKPRELLGAVMGKPEAVVKIVPNGGAKTAQGLRDQLSYLSREGTLDIEDAVSATGLALSSEDLDMTVEGWSAGFKGSPKFGHTAHFVVSFPRGTVDRAAYFAGRDFAEQAFRSGEYGDRWDYVTAFHTDTHHPHMHIVINKTGESGTWLSTRRDSLLNTDALRELQAEKARSMGIDMVATPRLVRGLTEPSLTTAEYRRAEREGRKPVPPHVDSTTRDAMAIAAKDHARAFRAMASMCLDESYELAELLLNAAATVEKGEPIMTEKPVSQDAEKSAEKVLTTTDQKRERIAELIEKVDGLAERTADPRQRAHVEVQAGELKAQVAGLFPERSDYQAHAIGQSAAYTHPAKKLERDPVVQQQPELREAAKYIYDHSREQIGEMARKAGVDGDRMLARIESGDKANRGTAGEWVAGEIREVLTHRGHDPATSSGEVHQAASSRVKELHASVGREMKKAAQVLRDFAAGRGLSLTERNEADPRRAEQERSRTQEQPSRNRGRTSRDRDDDGGLER